MINIKNESKVTDYVSVEELDNSIKSNSILNTFDNYEVLDNMIVMFKGYSGTSYYKFIVNDNGELEAYWISKDGKQLGDSFLLK